MVAGGGDPSADGALAVRAAAAGAVAACGAGVLALSDGAAACGGCAVGAAATGADGWADCARAHGIAAGVSSNSAATVASKVNPQKGR